MEDVTIGFIGLGLIGGSIAKGFRRLHPEFTLIAYNRSELALKQAYEDGTIQKTTNQIDDSFSDCDIIFLCTPVEYNAAYIDQLKPLIKPTCIITDVGSVKTNIHEAVEQAGLNKNFIGGHPMAGSEKTGYSNASAHLVENAFYALTPTKQTANEDLEFLRNLIVELGAIPVILDYRQHDYVVAAISHLPHLVAASLVNLVKDSDSEDQTMKLIAAGGFKDITRIASSSPEMWQQICMTNQENITLLLDKYIQMLLSIKSEVEIGNEHAIYQLFQTSREYRNSFSETSLGPIKKRYAITCDIIDEAGAISTIATILASNNISIKNIGIVNNRESEEGVLRIEFNDNDSAEKSITLLRKYKYTVHER